MSDGSHITYRYNDRRQVTLLQKQAPNQPLSLLRYEYDATGHKIAETQAHNQRI